MLLSVNTVEVTVFSPVQAVPECEIVTAGELAVISLAEYVLNVRFSPVKDIKLSMADKSTVSVVPLSNVV